MTVSLLYSVAAGLITAILASLWAAVVGDGLGAGTEAEARERVRDIRTW